MSASQLLRAEAAKRIIVKDGAYGTSVQARKLQAADYCGGLDLLKDQRQQRPSEHQQAGGRPLDLRKLRGGWRRDSRDEHVQRQCDQPGGLWCGSAGGADQPGGCADHARGSATAIQRRTASRVGLRGRSGQTNKTLSLSPNVNDPGFREVDFDEVKAIYREQIEALVEGGVDFILIETVFDTLNAKSAIMAGFEAEQALGRELPLMVSMTLTILSGRNLSGHTVEAFWASVRHARPLTIGLNCSFGAAQLRPHLAALSAVADALVMAYPNAGLPNELGEYDEAAEETARQFREWGESGLVNIVGGCCGTTPAHIAAIAGAVRDCTPRAVPAAQRGTLLAGLEPMLIAA